MKPLCARIGAFVLALAAMSCGGAGRLQPGVGVPTAGHPQARPDSLPAPDAPATGLAEPGECDPALDLDLLDPASYAGSGHRSFVIVDPANPQNLKGFVRLGPWLSGPVLEYTGLDTGSVRRIDPMTLPIWVGVGGGSQAAMQTTVEYLTHGGFVLGLGEPPPDLEHALEKYAGLVSGADFWSQRLTSDHPIFHAFFDLTAASSMGSGPTRGDTGTTGFIIGDRLVGVSDMPGGDRGLVNAVVFGLTQPGGIAQRYLRR